MRIDADAAKRELGHIGAAHRHQPRRQQALHDRRTGHRLRRVRKHHRAGRRGLAGYVQQILQADRDTRIATWRPSSPAQRVPGVGAVAGVRLVYPDKHPRPLPARIKDALQTRLDQRTARGAPLGQRIGSRLDRQHRANVAL